MREINHPDLTTDSPYQLQSMRATLAADGYALDAREDGERVVVTISATPEACEDCLAPPDVMLAILGKTLAVPAEAIELHYPAEAGAS